DRDDLRIDSLGGDEHRGDLDAGRGRVEGPLVRVHVVDPGRVEVVEARRQRVGDQYDDLQGRAAERQRGPGLVRTRAERVDRRPERLVRHLGRIAPSPGEEVLDRVL